jgi:hypothetical protein
MKAVLGIVGVGVLVVLLAVPVFARGPGWGRGPGMMGYGPREPGYCRQGSVNATAAFQGSGGRWGQAGDESAYDQPNRGVPYARGYKRGFDPGDSASGYGPGTGRGAGSGMGRWR